MKYDDALVSMEGEQCRIKHQHRLHCKLLAMRHFEETMQQSQFRIKEQYFRHLLSATDDKKHRFGAIELFKGILEGNGKAKLKRCLQKWYQTACNPTKALWINENLPMIYAEKKVWAFYFNRWRFRFNLKRTEKASKRTKLAGAFNVV